MLIDWRDVRFEVFSGHGPGGQARNKCQKCVRAIHEPTGVVAVATRERSLAQNKAMAVIGLQEKLEALKGDVKARLAEEKRASQPKNGFGAKYVRTYRMVPPANVMDHATGIESVLSVLDGKLDHIIKARLGAK